jgi:PncC family amidohydrolase
VGGVTAYRDEIKISHLGIDPELIDKYTVISEEVAVAMAKGAIKSFGTTWAIGTTGVAGPNPLDGHPVGAVWVAIEGPISQSIELSLSGERESVRNAATSSAIAIIKIALKLRQVEGVMTMVLVREAVGQTLRAARTAQGRTLRDVARDARVSLGYLSEVERGQKEASSELLNAICTALGLSLSGVFTQVASELKSREGVTLTVVDAA